MKNEKQSLEYAKHILPAIEEYCRVHPEGITQKELVLEVLKKAGGHSSGNGYSNAQSGVSRAVNRLIKNKRVSQTEENKYVPYNARYLKVTEKERIAKEIIFTNKEVFKVSDSTVLVSVDSASMYTAPEQIKKYLGPENCFDITLFNSYLVVMLRGDSAELERLRQNLEDLVSVAVEYRKKVNRNRLKIKQTTDD